MRARTALPEGYYVVETRPGEWTPYHRTDDMMFFTGAAPGALVPIGPSQSHRIRAVRFCYDRAGVPWDSRKPVTSGAAAPTTTTAHPGKGQVSPSDVGGVLPKQVAKRSRQRTA